MYQCICESCDEEDVRETLARAQAFFDDHAERGHNPEFQKFDGEYQE